MALEVVGRDAELSSLSAFLDRRTPVRGPAAIALEGDAGIGKSTLWRAAVEDARDRDLRVLSSQPAESERALAHAGLGDLFEGTLDDVLPALTLPRRRALEVALLLEDAAGGLVDVRALGVAVRSALEVLVEDGPVLVAIDNLQWLDASSASALGFALRRMPDADLRVLWTRRLAERAPPSPVESALEPDHVEHIRVGPLSVGAIHQVVRALLTRPLPRPTLLRLYDVSGGNPFYALELARALDVDAHDPAQAIVVPELLEELVAARLDGFTGSTHEALVLAAADPRLRRDQLVAAGIEQSDLDEALAAHVLELADGTVRFTHPLLASVLYQRLSVAERQVAHRCLAAVSDDPIVRARHLALSTDGADAELAGVLENAARSADGQGAPSVAAELGEHALRLTPAHERLDLDRRAAMTARARCAAGEVDRARALAGELLARAAAGSERADALLLLAEIESEVLQNSAPLLTAAALEPGAPLATRALAEQRLSLVIRFTEGLAAAERHADAAVELAEQLGDTTIRAAALAGLALIRFNAAKPRALELAEEAYVLSTNADGTLPVADAGFVLGHVLVWSAHFDRARALFERLYADWSQRDERYAADALWYLALVELRAGRLALAEQYAEQSRELSALYAGDEPESPQTFGPATLIAAQRGDLTRARELAAHSRHLAELHRSRLSFPMAMSGTIELWSGDPAAAVEWFGSAEEVVDAPDIAEPGMCWWRAEQVEALLEVGRLEDAADRLAAWEAAARSLHRDWVLAHATRCRGLVAAARGEIDHSLALFEEAVGRHEAADDPFGRARALLALGATRRRARQKRPAREALEAARAGFEAIGAVGWAATVQAELGAIGGQTRSDGLTPAERRVADLVAQGRTNSEVAASLFLAERTVASHLTRVYAKLGVRSRTELARKLA